MKEEDVKSGSELTLLTEIGDFKKGDKVKVAEVITTGGYYSNFFNIWIPERLSMIKVTGVYGHWFPRCFEEIKYLQSDC